MKFSIFNSQLSIIIVVLIFAVSCNFSNKNKEKHSAENAVVPKDTVFASEADSLEWMVKNIKNPKSERINICERLSWDLMYNDLEKSIYYAKLGLDLSKNNENDSIRGLLYCDLGMAYTFKLVYDTAKIFFDKSLDCAIKTKDENLESFLYNAYSKLYADQGNNAKDIEYLEKALRLSEKTGNFRRVATVLHALGVLYLNEGNKEQAEKYLLKAIEIYNTKVINPTNQDRASMYSTLGSIYLKQKRYENAFETFQKAITNARLADSKYDEAEALLNLSEFYSLYKKDDIKALEMANQALFLANEMGSNQLKTNSLVTIGFCYFNAKNYSKSKVNYLQALKLTESNDLPRKKNTLRGIIEASIMLKESEEAFDTFHTYDSLMVAINNKQVQYALTEMEAKYETEKKDIQIVALQKERELMIWLSIAVGVALLLVLATFFFLWRWTIQKRKLAETRIKQFEQEKQLVATQAVLDGETQERSRLARDLHDGLGSMLTGVKMNLADVKTGVTLPPVEVERFNNAMTLLDESITEMRRVAHHLMPDSLNRAGLKPAVSDFCSTVSPKVVFDYFGDYSRLDPMLEIVIYRSIHELVNNALKHSGASQILVQIMQEPDRIAFTVQDDGCGFDPAAETSGNGLQNIRNRIASFGGNINIDSKKDEGTEINVEFKI